MICMFCFDLKANTMTWASHSMVLITSIFLGILNCLCGLKTHSCFATVWNWWIVKTYFMPYGELQEHTLLRWQGKVRQNNNNNNNNNINININININSRNMYNDFKKPRIVLNSYTLHFVTKLNKLNLSVFFQDFISAAPFEAMEEISTISGRLYGRTHHGRRWHQWRTLVKLKKLNILGKPRVVWFRHLLTL